MLKPEAADALRLRAERDADVLAISAITGEGLEDFQTVLAEALQGAVREAELMLPFAEGKKRAWLFEQDVVVSEDQSEEGFALTVRWSAKQEAQFQQL